MGDFPYLEYLTRVYSKKAEEKGDWVNYLKAHGLANACVARDSREERRRQVYDIENGWYKGKHPLSYEKHKVLTNQHRELLNDYRKATRTGIEHLKPNHEALSIDKMFSKDNLSLADKFSDEVFDMSKACSDGLVEVSRRIIDSSVKVLSDCGESPPCPFSVIGLGSVACGVATPYSDLEYAFIVESSSDKTYFTHLAVDTYFRIGNLCETPLKCFDIEELSAEDKNDRPSFSDTLVGFKIDGISPNAGNIPTGNEEGRDLILTVDEFVQLYKESVVSPLVEDLPGDDSDLLSNHVLVYFNDGGQELYDSFKHAMVVEMELARNNSNVLDKRLRTVSLDMRKYQFLPEIKSFGPPDNSNITIKDDIFRYPTLLASHIKVSLALKSPHPWNAYQHLGKLGQLSHQNHIYMKILLALSIFIRTSAYITSGSQLKQLSLYTCSSKPAKEDQYHVPRNLFVTLGCLLVPLKSTVLSYLESRVSEACQVDQDYKMEGILRSFHVSESDCLVTVEVLFFAGDYDGALRTLYKSFDEKTVNGNSAELSSEIYKASGSQDVMKYIQICCYLLCSARKYSYALEHLKWLSCDEASTLDKVRWMILSADCLNKIHNYKEANDLLVEVIKILRGELKLSKLDSLHGHVLTKLQVVDTSLLELVTHTYRLLGETFSLLSLFEEAKEIIEICRKLSLFVVSNLSDSCKGDVDRYEALGGVYLEIGDYQRSMSYFEKSLEILHGMYGEHAVQHDIARIYGEVGRVYKRMGVYERSLEYFNKSLDFMTLLHNEVEHIDVANVHGSLGGLCSDMGKHEEALFHHNRSLSIMMIVYERDSTHPDVALVHQSIGNAYFTQGAYSQSLDSFRKALENLQTKYQCAFHPDLAKLYGEIAKVYIKLENNELSESYSTKSLEMIKSVYEGVRHTVVDLINLYPEMKQYTTNLKFCTKELNIHRFSHDSDINHPDIANSYLNIGFVYLEMGVYDKSYQNYCKALDMYKVMYGDTAAHQKVAIAYNNIGDVYKYLGKRDKALRYYTTSVEMQKAVYGDNTNHPNIAISYSNIGDVYDKLGKYDEALRYYTMSGGMYKAVYGDDTNHPSIAISYNNIGDAYRHLGKHDEALRYYTMSVGMYKAVYGDDTNHANIAISYNNIGNVYKRLGKHDEALRYYTMSVGMYKAVYGDDTNHANIAISYSNIGYVYDNLGKYDEALRYYTMSVEMMKAVYGDYKHPHVAVVESNIADLREKIRVRKRKCCIIQ